MYCNITNIIFKLSKDYLNKYNSLNEKFEIPFLKFCLNSSFIYYNQLPNYFTLLNWNDLFEIIKKLSEIKSQNDNNIENKYDIIFDNFSFSNEQPKYLLFSLPNSDKSSLYIEEFIVQKEILKNKNTLVLGVIEEITNSQEIYKIEYINHEKQFTYSNVIINDLDIKDGIKIRFNPEANNFFVKVRISNYKFFNEKIDPLLKPCIELFNNILKKFSFYLGYDDKITNLFNTRLFSLGIPKNKNKDKNNSDLKLFEEYLNNINLKTIFQTKKSSSEINLEEDEEITTEKKKINEDSSLEDLISNNNIINVIKRFENQMKIIIKGEIPDKIVKYAFFIILHHENLLEIFINYCQDENQQKESENILKIFFML